MLRRDGRDKLVHVRNPTDHQLIGTSVYNSRNLRMPPFSRVRLACCAIALCTLSSIAEGTDWRPLVAQLSTKIASDTGPGVVALEITNRSSINAADLEAIRRELTSSLASSGVRVWQPEQAAGTVKVTLSESLKNYVWVAEVRQGVNDVSTLIVSMPRPESAMLAQNSPPLLLQATMLQSQQNPILDVALVEGNPRRMLMLGAGAITPYEFRDNHWIADQPLAINSDRPLPRDLRGRIVLRKDHLFDAYLPGLACHSTNAAPLGMNCAHSDDPWPLQTEDPGVSAFFAPAQNFFTGALVPGIGKQKSAPAFYSAAAVPREKYALWIFAGVDGQLHLLDGINQQTLPKIHWGSDIAAIQTPCHTGWQVLATSSESDSADTIQAFEFPDREPVAVSQKLDLNGTVTALWTAQSGETAIAVVHNAENGNYEANLLNLTCGQ
jgi:hypothetical protein